MDSLKETGLEYFESFGFDIVPMVSKSQPAIKWTGFNDGEYSKAILENFDWNANITGLSVRLGKNNLRAIDIDKIKDPELLRKLIYNLGLPAEYEWVVNSGSGCGHHIYFYTDDDSELERILRGVKTCYVIKPRNEGQCDHIELRWRGCLLMLPPSMHPSGNDYRFANCREDEIPSKKPSVVRVGKLISALKALFIMPDEVRQKGRNFCDDIKLLNASNTNIRKLTPKLRKIIESATEYMAGKIEDYETWRKCTFALASLGEDGREYFLKLSENNPKYPQDTRDALNKIFDMILRNYNGKISIGTYFEIAKKYGFEFPIKEFWFLHGGKVKLRPERMLEVLYENGFAKMVVGKQCLYVRVENRIVKEVLILEMKSFIESYIETNASGQDKQLIKRSVIRQAASIFSTAQLEFLPTLEPTFQRDKKDTAYFYFKNCYVEVNKGGIKVKQYTEMKEYIWHKQVIDFELKTTNKCSEFDIFITRICKGDFSRKNALVSAIGYLLHSYKDPSVTKAIIFTDEKLSDDAYGRSGKGLVVHAIMKMKNILKLDMQNHSMDKSFGFQSVNLDTQVIWMDELKKGFPFVRLYSLLAEGMTIEKKNKNEFFIPYGEAPKFVITSNFSVAGHDDSSLDRQFVIEFFDHYKRKYKPSDEFGHLFFTDWDTEEWNAFYFLMMDYCRYFLSNGLKDYEHVNLNMKKLIDETCNEFADFITKLPFNIERDKKELFEEFLEENESYKEIKYFKQNTFSKWIKKYCQIFDYQLVERKSNKQYLVSINKS